MTLTPLVKVLLVMNNYFHDVATAVLLSSAVIMYVLGKRAAQDGPRAVEWLATLYPMLGKFARGALIWIVIGGVPRTIFFAQLEWDPAKTKYMVPALAVKHTLMVVAVVAGVLLWRRVRKMIEGGSLVESTGRLAADN